jgi:hypothetical protein
MTGVVPFKRRNYEAVQVVVLASGMTVTVAGTLDGYLDFVVEAQDGTRLIHQITRDDARSIVAALHAVVADITANCRFDRDPLLMPSSDP